jgi:hypothetical protein
MAKSEQVPSPTHRIARMGEVTNTEINELTTATEIKSRVNTTFLPLSVDF